MKLFDYLFLTFRQFKTRKLRTFLTMFAIAIGIGATFLLVSFVYGVQYLITDRIAPEKTLLTIDVLPKDILKIDKSAVERIENISRVTNASPIITLTGQASKEKDDTFADISLNGVEPVYIELENLKVVTGKRFTGTNEVMLSEAAVKLFENDANSAIGKKLDINALVPISNSTNSYNLVNVGRSLTISGVIEGSDVATAYLDLSNLEKVETEAEYGLVKVSVDSAASMNNVKSAITALGYDAQAVFDTVEETTKLFSYVKIVFAFFGIIGLVVASIGMFNTLTISLLERTRDVGFMKAFGATNRDVMRLFLVEAMMMGFWGGTLGICLGYTIGKIISTIINLVTSSSGSPELQIFFSPVWFTISMVVFSAALGLVTGFYPARRAAKISALEAIRYE